MKKPLFDFQEQLVVGNVGENDFLKYYAKLNPRKSLDRKIDIFLGDGTSIELKTDTYNMEATENFFMELYSDESAGVIGGPWRAQQDHVEFFVYYFPKNKTFFWFKTEQLCAALETIISESRLNLKTIRNKGWNAQGYAIPRTRLEAALYKKETF